MTSYVRPAELGPQNRSRFVGSFGISLVSSPCRSLGWTSRPVVGTSLPTTSNADVVDPTLPLARHEESEEELLSLLGHVEDDFVFLPVGRALDRPPHHVVERQTGLLFPVDAHPQPCLTLDPVRSLRRRSSADACLGNAPARKPLGQGAEALVLRPRVDLTLPLALPACFSVSSRLNS